MNKYLLAFNDIEPFGYISSFTAAKEEQVKVLPTPRSMRIRSITSEPMLSIEVPLTLTSISYSPEMRCTSWTPSIDAISCAKFLCDIVGSGRNEIKMKAVIGLPIFA